MKTVIMLSIRSCLAVKWDWTEVIVQQHMVFSLLKVKKKNPNHPTPAAETEEVSANVTAALAQGLSHHPIDKPMHVFALYRGGTLASMLKQIMGLGNLIPCPNSFPKQVVAYLLFLLLAWEWKEWTREEMRRERPMLGFVAPDVKRGHMDQCPVIGNVFSSLLVAPTTLSGWSL